MTADALNLLAEIRRSGGDVRLVDCDRLKLIAPATLLPELAERVRAAKPMLLAALTYTNRKASTSRGGGVCNPRRNGATVQHLAAESSSGPVISPSAADWRARHREALVHWGALHCAEEAARLAWGEIENRWHMQHGECAPHWRCAGCGAPIGGLAALTLADSNRVHLDTFHCLIAFGERWRRNAAAALKALGLDPPAEIDS